MLRLRADYHGDTIVEVLIAIMVISFVLVTAYVTTSRNTQTIQNTQERNVAQKLVASQIESLYAGRPDPAHFPNGSCYDTSTGSVTSGAGCVLGGQAGSGASYKLTITTPGGAAPANCGPASTNAYAVCANWTSIGGPSNNDSNVTMYYRVN